MSMKAPLRGIAGLPAGLFDYGFIPVGDRGLRVVSAPWFFFGG